MAWLEPRTSGIGSNHSADWTATIALSTYWSAQAYRETLSIDVVDRVVLAQMTEHKTRRGRCPKQFLSSVDEIKHADWLFQKPSTICNQLECFISA